MTENHFIRIHKFKKKKSFFKKRIFWDLILILILIILLFYLLFFTKAFILEKNKIKFSSQDNFELSKKIEVFLTKQLGKNIFLLNLDLLEKQILEDYSVIEQIEIKRQFPNGLLAEIKQRKAIGIGCINYERYNIDAKTQNKDCYLFDRQGIFFQAIEDFDIKDNIGRLIIFLDIKGSIKLGQKVISERTLDKILKIYQELQRLEIEIEKFVLVGDKRLNVKTNFGWEIYFDLTNDLDLTLTKLRLLLEKVISLEDQKKLEYIDLRFLRAYYKYFESQNSK